MPIEFLSVKRVRFDEEATALDYIHFKGSNPRDAQYWASRSIAERVIACWELGDEYQAMQTRLRDAASLQIPSEQS